MKQSVDIFKRSTLIGLSLFALIMFFTTLYLMLNVKPTESTPAGATTWSSHALGRQALFELLNQLGISARRNTTDYAFNEPQSPFVILSELQELTRYSLQTRAYPHLHARLYVLPKRRTSSTSHGLHPVAYAQRALDLADGDALIVRPDANDLRLQRRPTNRLTSLTSSKRGSQLHPSLNEGQFVLSDTITPIVAFGDLILVGEIQSKKPRTWVLTDPDILDNHGLDDGDNALLAVRVITTLQELTDTQDEEITFYERILTFENTPSFFQILVRFPYSLISVAFIFLCAILGWLSLVRFGDAAPPSPSVGVGRRPLVDTATQLVRGHDNQTYILERYFNNVVRDVAIAMKLPNKIDYEEGVDSAPLIKIEMARAVRPQINEIKSEVKRIGAAPSPRARDLIKVAQRLHNWRKEMLDES